ncbi:MULTISPECIES: acyl-CoA dehydrogenase [unclassified Microbacterium]|uniref:acyl-CoA dehydrogenase n=1 Tax=unclassified Microbacterium TaxID=2609290 RepID=UPI00214C62B0|nr:MULTISPECIES: acyl-CoA dehydrogenase [unclassified Microbacterium]MCR2808723.1 acyl-CoA dehydrogenase [Microbacterium sp. zg.B185]WIM18846.1 acyl-CoA dehydrogenase [Microbacterium sp. zg-B185]
MPIPETAPVTSLAPGTAPGPLIVEAMARADTVPGFGTDPVATLGWCVDIAGRAPRLGGGSTRQLWELLAATAARDVSAARMLEPHLDALGILRQWGDAAPDRADTLLDPVHADEASTWGVFAAEARDMTLTASEGAGAWRLSGRKPWCSLAGQLSHALVTASVDDSRRGLFAVELDSRGVRPHGGPWFARGLADVVSAPVDFDDVAAVQIGPADWYLSRPGFAWGGMSVAAAWWGAAVGLAETLRAAAGADRADQLALVHLGRVDAALWAARSVLAEAADLIDAGESDRIGDRLLAERVRGVVVDAATLTLAEADAALGPAPLIADERHARRVADLHLYLRQHHGLRDTARAGRLILEAAAG